MYRNVATRVMFPDLFGSLNYYVRNMLGTWNQHLRVAPLTEHTGSSIIGTKRVKERSGISAKICTLMDFPKEDGLIVKPDAGRRFGSCILL